MHVTLDIESHRSFSYYRVIAIDTDVQRGVRIHRIAQLETSVSDVQAADFQIIIIRHFIEHKYNISSPPSCNYELMKLHLNLRRTLAQPVSANERQLQYIP